MTPHTVKKNNSNKRNVKRAALIKYELACQGYKLLDIANDLKISSVAVTRSLYGLSTVTRVDEWLCDKLGKEVVNA